MRPQAHGTAAGTSRLVLSVILTVTVWYPPTPTTAISCRVCHPDQCPPVPQELCEAGVTTDICGCCQECARALNQSCGGKYGLLGRCGPGLKCFITPKVGEAISGQEDGVCRAFGPNNCTSEDCEAIGDVTLQCPLDSDLIVNSTGSDTRSLCVCNTSYCTVPVCAAGFESVLHRKADLRPGSCCDEFVCKRTVACRSVICPPAEDKTCPPDSDELPNQLTDDGCCYIKKRCRCKSEDHCPPVECPLGSQVQITEKASDMPGSCCDKFHCINDTCKYDGTKFNDGESWQLEKCTMCECRDGLTFCKTKTCNAPLCGWMVIPKGECCPVCKGCVSDSGSLYNNSDVWKENPCVTCQCNGGQVLCQAEMCAVRCSEPRQVPGQCCPVCDDIPLVDSPRLCKGSLNCSLTCSNGLEETEEGCFLCKCKKEECKLDCPFGFTSNANGTKNCECAPPRDHCPSLDDCFKQCTYGLKKSRNGCLKCRCNKCPPFNCTKRCLYGYILNDQGCELCKCKDAPMLTTTMPSTNDNLPEPSVPTSDTSCMSASGLRHEDGESWHDGCRLCYCHNGHEMCSLIACPVPRCDNPVFRIGDCCPSCPGVLGIASKNGSKEACQSTTGQYLVEGEMWKMDNCTQCICHDGSILCESATCPPVLCHHPIKPSDECCAQCAADDNMVTSPVLSPRPCKSDSGVVYKDREVWKTSPCQSCTCRNSQVHCYSQMCPTLNCNKTVLKKGQCCPECLEVTLPGICTKDGITYSTGERWQSDNCTECQCNNGKIACTPIPCPRLTCTVMIRKPSECCPKCFDSPVTTSLHEKSFPTITTERPSTKRYTTEGPTEDFKAKDNYMIGIVLLGVLLSIALIVVLVLVLVILRRRHTGMFKMSDSPVVIKIRPKSTNLELQGVNPFLLDSPSKQINCERKNRLEKQLLGPAVIPSEKKLDLSPHHHQYQRINTNPDFEPKKEPPVTNGNCVSNKTFDQV